MQRKKIRCKYDGVYKMLKITITELRKNFDYYLSLANKEEIYVTKYGKTISVMTPPEQYLKLQAILKKTL